MTDVSWGRVSSQAMATAAGVGMGSLYRRYPSKEALLQHLKAALVDTLRR